MKGSNAKGSTAKGQLDARAHFHVRKGDQVVVISGNDKGKTGEVKEVQKKTGRVLVAGVNLRWKHQKPTQQQPKGERTQRETPIHHSNVMLLDPKTGKGTRRRPA